LAGGLSLRGHFYSVREGTLSNSFNSAKELGKKKKSKGGPSEETGKNIGDILKAPHPKLDFGPI
jgi:hypothetical protein